MLEKRNEFVNRRMTRLENIPIEKISMRLDKYNYRHSNTNEYDTDNQHIKELADSIRYQGLINPITVIKSTQFGHMYDIVAGHRRFIACTLLQMKEIPCNILDSNQEAEQIYLVGLTENIQRNNLKPLEEAIGFRKYMELFNIPSVRQLAMKIGKSHPYISSRLLMLDLPVHIIHAVHDKQISLTLLDDINSAICNKKLKNELIEFIYQKKLNHDESDNLFYLVKAYEKDYLDKNKQYGLNRVKIVDMDTLSLEQVFKRYQEETNKIINKDSSVSSIIERQEEHIREEDERMKLKRLGYEMKYRTRFEIVTTILKSVADNTRFDQRKRKFRGIASNRIMYTNYLAFKQIKDYLAYLLQKNMIEKHNIIDKEYKYKNKIEYVITQKGLQFLQQAITLFKMIDVKEFVDIDLDNYSNEKVLTVDYDERKNYN